MVSNDDWLEQERSECTGQNSFFPNSQCLNDRESQPVPAYRSETGPVGTVCLPPMRSRQARVNPEKRLLMPSARVLPFNLTVALRTAELLLAPKIEGGSSDGETELSNGTF